MGRVEEWPVAGGRRSEWRKQIGDERESERALREMERAMRERERE